MAYRYHVLLPLAGEEGKYELAVCETVEAALAVIDAVLANTIAPPATVLIRLVPAG
jgi:hypothetical protein